MSLRTELEELIKWFADLTADAEPPPEGEPLPRETWQSIKRSLETTAKTFEEARVTLAGRGEAVLAEFALDLHREAENLALRAHLLGRRADPKPKPPEPPAATTPAATTPAADTPAADTEAADTQPADNEAVEKEAEKEAGKQAGDTNAGDGDPDADGKTTRKAKQSADPPAKIVGRATTTIENALDKIGEVERRDVPASAFEDELDALAEMTLSLRQRCEHLDHEEAVR